MGADRNTSGLAEARKPWHSSVVGFFRTHRHYFSLCAVAAFSAAVYRYAYLLQGHFRGLMDIASYLTWHNIFEFSSILVSFAVFIVSYFTYEQTKNLSALFLGNISLAVGIIDMFHTLSYMGMPAFFIENLCANRATTFWIISRMVFAVGILAASFIKPEKEARLNKRFFFICAVLFSFIVLITATYYPGLLPRMYIEGQGLTPVKIMLEYFAIFFLLLTGGKYLLDFIQSGDPLAILFVAALVLGVFSELAFTSYYSVYDIYNYLGHVYKVISYYIIFRVIFIHSVQKPYIELSAAESKLRAYAENLDRIVEQRTFQVKRINEKLLNDLEYARDIQLAMLPTELPEVPQIAFSARYFPAERVSGDFYNVFRIDARHIGFYIGDVSGHGVPAAMLTVFLNQNMHAERESNGNKGGMTDPSMVLENLYRSFNNTNFREDVYIVLIYGVLNTDTLEMTYASAGMNVPPFAADISGMVREVEIRGFPICKFIEYYPVQYDTRTLKLKTGDRVLFYTDGLVEAQNEEGKRFSQERLKSLLGRDAGLPASELANSIVKDMFNFIDTSKLKDDITFFIMEVK